MSPFTVCAGAVGLGEGQEALCRRVILSWLPSCAQRSRIVVSWSTGISISLSQICRWDMCHLFLLGQLCTRVAAPGEKFIPLQYLLNFLSTSGLPGPNVTWLYDRINLPVQIAGKRMLLSPDM